MKDWTFARRSLQVLVGAHTEVSNTHGKIADKVQQTLDRTVRARGASTKVALATTLASFKCSGTMAPSALVLFNSLLTYTDLQADYWGPAAPLEHLNAADEEDDDPFGANEDRHASKQTRFLLVSCLSLTTWLMSAFVRLVQRPASSSF